VSATVADIAEEAQRVVAAATEQGAVVRISGGVAFHLRVQGRIRLPRAPANDIDLVAPAGTERRVSKVLVGLGYEAEKAFNARHGETRLMFWDRGRDRKLEVFVGTFLMCHRIPIAQRLDIEQETIPLAELLLTKLQIVELNEKDVSDMHMLLASHDVGSADGEVINVELIAHLCAADWGLHHTVIRTLDRLRSDPPGYRLEPAHRELVDQRVGRIKSAIDQKPKTVAWRLRARLGERVSWYVQPEEFV
jgi:hypothetical protein